MIVGASELNLLPMPGSCKIGRSLKEVERPREERIHIRVEREISWERQRESTEIGEVEAGWSKPRPYGVKVITAGQVDPIVACFEIHQPWRGARAGTAIRAGECI